MIYLIIGSAVTLAGVGLIVSKISPPGIILLRVGPLSALKDAERLIKRDYNLCSDRSFYR